MNRLKRISLLALPLLLAACAGHAPRRLTLTGSGPGGLPAVAQLGKTASGYLRVNGADYFYAAGGLRDGDSLVLSYEALSQVPGGEPFPSPMPYAIYTLAGVSDPAATLEVKTASGGDVPYWLGLADYRRGVWDFSLGRVSGSTHLGWSDLPGAGASYVSAAGRVTVAVVLWQTALELVIRHVEVVTIEDVSELAASSDRWDGIQLEWEAPESAQGFLIHRRPAEQPGAEWVAVTAEPLAQHADGYLDAAAPEAEPTDYRVMAGICEVVGGLPRWFWSPGVAAEGARLPTALAGVLGDAEPLAAYWPANMYRYLSFFYLPATAPATIEGVRSMELPPGGEWEMYDAATPGFGGYTLSAAGGFGAPFALHQRSTQNNPTLTLLYSTAAGTFARITDVSEAGATAWEEPVQLREAGQHLLGVVDLPRRLGAITWNPLLARIEMVDSQDLAGRLWYAHDPASRPSHVVGGRRPDGPVETCALTGGERIVFRELDTAEVVVYTLHGDWIDESPGVTAGPGATMRDVLNGVSLPGEALIYLTADGRRIRLLRQNLEGQWLLFEQVDLVILPPGSAISEFKLLTTGDVSYLNYLAYVLDGDLYVTYSGSPRLTDWWTPVLADDSGDVRDVDVVVVGTDDNWQSLRFVTYVSDDAAGVGRLRFRELASLILPY